MSRRTNNKLLTNAHGIFERARSEDTWALETNPVKKVRRLDEDYDPGDFSFYSKEEVWALARATRGERRASSTSRSSSARSRSSWPSRTRPSS